MGWGRFSIYERDGTGDEFTLSAATLTIGQTGGEWWLTVYAQTMPPDWMDSQNGDIPEFPALDVSVRIPSPDVAGWVGREFLMPEGFNLQSGCYPGWVYTSGGYDSLRECVVSVGERVGDRIEVHVAGRGVRSGCLVRISGEFTFVDDMGSAGG